MNNRYIDFVPVKPQTPKSSPHQSDVLESDDFDNLEDFIEGPATPTVTTVRTSVTEETTVFLPEEKQSPIIRPHFINAEKVAKRPLSPNVPAHRTAPVRYDPPTSPSAPVTIIDKPKKDSRTKFIIIIILTIVLGAAAGAAAFLLLPK